MADSIIVKNKKAVFFSILIMTPGNGNGNGKSVSFKIVI